MAVAGNATHSYHPLSMRFCVRAANLDTNNRSTNPVADASPISCSNDASSYEGALAISFPRWRATEGGNVWATALAGVQTRQPISSSSLVVHSSIHAVPPCPTLSLAAKAWKLRVKNHGYYLGRARDQSFPSCVLPGDGAVVGDGVGAAMASAGQLKEMQERIARSRFKHDQLPKMRLKRRCYASEVQVWSSPLRWGPRR